jgi:hypothetical protein
MPNTKSFYGCVGHGCVFHCRVDGKPPVRIDVSICVGSLESKEFWCVLNYIGKHDYDDDGNIIVNDVTPEKLQECDWKGEWLTNELLTVEIPNANLYCVE